MERTQALENVGLPTTIVWYSLARKVLETRFCKHFYWILTVDPTNLENVDALQLYGGMASFGLFRRVLVEDLRMVSFVMKFDQLIGHDTVCGGFLVFFLLVNILSSFKFWKP